MPLQPLLNLQRKQAILLSESEKKAKTINMFKIEKVEPTKVT